MAVKEFAKIENELVVNVAMIEEAEIGNFPGVWVDISAEPGVGIGWGYNGSVWSEPALVVPAPPTDDEQEVSAITAAAKITQKATITAKLEASELSDDEVKEVAALYPRWSGESVAYTAGDVVRYLDGLYKVVQGHTSQAAWTPDAVPALFTAYRAVGSVTAWVQPTGAQDAYDIGERVTHNAATWESNINANVWEPGSTGAESLWTAIA